MANRTRLREDVKLARDALVEASMMQQGDPRAQQLIDAAFARLGSVADGGGEPDELTPEQLKERRRIFDETNELSFGSDDRPIAHISATTGSFRRPIDGNAVGVPLREGGLLAAMGIRESTADVGRIDGNTRSTGDLDNLPLIVDQASFFNSLRMYDRGAGNDIGVGQDRLREHIVEKGYELGLSGRLPEQWKIREARSLREAARGTRLPDGSDGGDLSLAQFMEPETERDLREATGTTCDLLDVMGIRKEDI
jgi:hypothetical protein